MKVYVVTMDYKYKQVCSYGDNGTYYETETNVMGVYDTEEKAKKRIEELEKEDTPEAKHIITYWWESCELE